MFPLMFLLALLALAAALLLLRRARRMAREAEAATRQAAHHARALGLLAEEVQPAGLALLGLADRAKGESGEEPGAAIAAEARRLLRLADEAKEMLAASAGPRSLAEERVELAPLLAEVQAEVAAQLGPTRRQWRLAEDF